MIKFAIPVKNGKLDSHFGHAAMFAIIEADQNSGEIQKITPVTPPEHAPGIIPCWIAAQGVTVVIASKMGDKAKQMLAELKIETLTGIAPAAPDELVKMYFAKTLVCTPVASCCGHDHGHDHDEHKHDHGHEHHEHGHHEHGHHEHDKCHDRQEKTGGCHGQCQGGNCHR